jgi:hypothetical protein
LLVPLPQRSTARTVQRGRAEVPMKRRLRGSVAGAIAMLVSACTGDVATSEVNQKAAA